MFSKASVLQETLNEVQHGRTQASCIGVRPTSQRKGRIPPPAVVQAVYTKLVSQGFETGAATGYSMKIARGQMEMPRHGAAHSGTTPKELPMQKPACTDPIDGGWSLPLFESCPSHLTSKHETNESENKLGLLEASCNQTPSASSSESERIAPWDQVGEDQCAAVLRIEDIFARSLSDSGLAE